MQNLIKSKVSEINSYLNVLTYHGEGYPLFWLRKFLELDDPRTGLSKEEYKNQALEIKMLIDQDRRNVKEGLYKPLNVPIRNIPKHFSTYRKVLSDSVISASRAKLNLNAVFSTEAQDKLTDVPDYYKRNFHFQTDGYLSDDSAQLYEHQTEVLFSGTLHLMRRVLMGNLIRKIKAQPKKTFKVLELACGTGVATRFLLDNCDNVKVTAVDLSQPYLDFAKKRCKKHKNVKFEALNASELGTLNDHYDLVFSCFLFHELPKKERINVIKSAQSVLKAKSLGQYHIDSIQLGDQPSLDPALENFPVHFHEPFYTNYIKTSYQDLVPEGCLTSEERAFLSKLVHVYNV